MFEPGESVVRGTGDRFALGRERASHVLGMGGKFLGWVWVVIIGRETLQEHTWLSFTGVSCKSGGEWEQGREVEEVVPDNFFLWTLSSWLRVINDKKG